MTACEYMAGPFGAPVKCYRRGVRQVRAGDWLPDHGAHVIAAPVADPDDGSVWVALEGGADVNLRTRRVWLYRTYEAPVWLAEALDAYRSAVAARDAARESGAPIPAGSVAGAADTSVGWMQLSDVEFRTAWPAPRLAEFIRDAAASHRAGRGDA